MKQNDLTKIQGGDTLLKIPVRACVYQLDAIRMTDTIWCSVINKNKAHRGPYKKKERKKNEKKTKGK